MSIKLPPVLHLIDHIGSGGAQRVVQQLVRHQSNQYVYALKPAANPMIMGDKIYTASHPYNPLTHLSSIRHITQKHHIQILHAHLLKAKILSLAVNTLSHGRYKILFHEHGDILKPSSWYPYLIQLSENRVDKYIAVSMAAQKQLDVYLKDKAKSQLIYNYYPPEIKLNQQHPRKFPPKKFTFGFIGRFVPLKNWHDVLMAMSKISSPQIHLHIAGVGKDQQSLLHTIDQFQLHSQVRFFGYVKNMNTWYRSIDCLIIASDREASPLAYYESQSLGIPIISSDVTALNEFIQHKKNGLLFPLHHIDALVARMKLVAQDQKLYQQLSASALAMVAPYSFNSYIKSLDHLYASV